MAEEPRGPSASKTLFSGDTLLQGLPEVDGYKLVGSCLLYGGLGKGGMGQVYKGHHLKFDIDVAVKCLKPDLAGEHPEFIDRFVREAQVAAKLNNENLIRVYETGDAAGVYYLVMEFVEGETARDRVARKGPLAVEEALRIVQGATRGLAAAHRSGIIHRDIKPDNILISYKGEVKLADLGLAKATTTESGMTVTGQGMGTPQYMPPEQFRDFKSAGPPADVYSMGATLYFLLTGERPFSGSSLHEIMHKVCYEGFPDITRLRKDLEPPVVELIRKSTASDPAARYRDAVAFSDALEEVVSDETVELDDEGAGTVQVATLVSPPPAKTLARARIVAETATMSTLGPKRARPRRRGMWAAAVLAVVGIGAGAWYLLGPPGAPESNGGPEGGGEGNPPAGVGTVVSGPDSASGAGAVRSDPEPPPPATPHLSAGAELARAGRLMDALAELQMAVESGEPGAPGALADAYFKLAERERATSPRGALGFVRESLGLVESRDARALAQELQAGIQSALRESIRVETPAALAQAPPAGAPRYLRSRLVELSGSVDESVRSLRINDEDALAAPGRFAWTTEYDSDGERTVTIVARDEVELEATKELRFVVDTSEPVLALLQPQILEVEPGQHTLKGSVKDSSRSVVKVGDQEVRPNERGEWEIALEIDAADQFITVSAVDEAGNEAAVLRLIVKTPWPKIPGLEIARPGEGAPWVYRLESDPSLELVLVLPALDDDGTFEFEMGNDRRFSPAYPKHRVRLRPFLIGRTEVTNAQYKRFCDATGKEPPPDPWRGYFLEEPSKPVVNVSWDDAFEFCRWLGANVKLPTEAQWEYAASAGEQRDFPWGRGLPTTRKDLANFSGYESTSDQGEADPDERLARREEDGYLYTSEVEAFKDGAGPFGAINQAGNVAEWCLDIDLSYQRGTAPDTGLRRPEGDEERSVARVHRGGGWAGTADQLRAAYRAAAPRDTRSDTIGIRVAFYPIPEVDSEE